MKIVTIFAHTICEAGREEIDYETYPVIGDEVVGTEHVGQVEKRTFIDGKVNSIKVRTAFSGDAHPERG